MNASPGGVSSTALSAEEPGILEAAFIHAPGKDLAHIRMQVGLQIPAAAPRSFDPGGVTALRGCDIA